MTCDSRLERVTNLIVPFSAFLFSSLGHTLRLLPTPSSPSPFSSISNFLNKRVYIQNDDTYEVIEYAWSDATPYTEANNLYATPFIEQGTASASSLQLSRGKPNLYLWTVGAQGGNVKEDDDTHGRNAKSCLYV